MIISQQRNHNPFRTRSQFDKLCIWFLMDGKLSRRYCTRTFRTAEGALGLERTSRVSKIATAARSAIVDPIILIENIA